MSVITSGSIGCARGSPQANGYVSKYSMSDFLDARRCERRQSIPH
jgi:hypothetical protein